MTNQFEILFIPKLNICDSISKSVEFYENKFIEIGITDYFNGRGSKISHTRGWCIDIHKILFKRCDIENIKEVFNSFNHYNKKIIISDDEFENDIVKKLKPRITSQKYGL